MEPLGDRAIGVGQQRIVEAVLVGELLLLLDGVGADPDALSAGLLELGGEIAEVAALLRAAERHRGWIEEQHDRTVEQELAQFSSCTRFVG